MNQTSHLKQAIVLFAHGARDPAWAKPLEGLQQLLVNDLGANWEVRLAFLELMQPSLPDSITNLTQLGCNTIHIVPVFFGQGGHMKKDFPVILQKLQEDHPHVQIQATEAVGQWAELWQALATGVANRLTQ